MNDAPELHYDDADLRHILKTVRTIAMVGASPNWVRPSNFAMKYLQGKGFKVIPVNPGSAGQEILGAMTYASLADIPGKFDMVDIFRSSEAAGPIVDEAALIAALTEGRIAGAAVDVYDVEPLPASHPLRSLDNLLMTPHTGYVSEQTYRSFYSQMVENIKAWHAGAPVRVITG